MVYVKLFVDYLDAIEPLGDAERGRLFTALLEYARTGEVPQLGGTERFIFPMMKAQLDRDAASNQELSEKRAAAGSLGGKQKQANVANGSKSYQDKDKDEEKDKDKDKDGRLKRPRPHFIPPTLDEVREYAEQRNSGVDPVKFWEYFNAGEWKDAKGQPVRNWKQKFLTWEKFDTPKPQAQPQAQGKPKSFAQIWREMDNDET